MPDVHQIRLNQLLLEREAQFVRVHDLEQAAAQILGEPYPFTRPALPSDTRRKSRPGPRTAASARDTLRRLEDGETAYRVTYRHGARECSEEHDDLEALRTLVAAQGSRLTISRIETLRADGTTAAVVFSRPAASGS